jgi:hypothetical protein
MVMKIKAVMEWTLTRINVLLATAKVPSRINSDLTEWKCFYQ